jgi:Ca2+-transporting ATPase
MPYLAITKGSVDGLLHLSRYVLTTTGVEPLTTDWQQRLEQSNSQLAQDGIRVLGLALRFLADPAIATRPAELESDLVFLGLVGMIDPPRPEVKAAVQTSRTAGIRPVMITGDHPLTARYIANDLGITAGDRVVTGQELAEMSPAELQALVEQVSVYARVSPEHKLRIVEALQANGHIVAMTGDGVNDAPALKKADIGVAMGITGTDVSKEAADMVLRDDNFATIVAAVEEGRVIYDNIRKFIKFSIAGNIGKVSVMLVMPLLNNALPLLPLHLLWLNLLTDGLLGLGMGVEPAEKNTMRRSPYSPQESIFARGLGWHITLTGLLIGLVAIGAGYGYWYWGFSNWQTMIFTTLAFAQVWQALAVRSSQESLFSLGFFSNRLLAVMVLVILSAQLAVIYIPFLQLFFSTQPLSPVDLGISLGLGSLVFIAIEMEKLLLHWRNRRQPASRPATYLPGSAQ